MLTRPVITSVITAKKTVFTEYSTSETLHPKHLPKYVTREWTPSK